MMNHNSKECPLNLRWNGSNVYNPTAKSIKYIVLTY